MCVSDIGPLVFMINRYFLLNEVFRTNIIITEYPIDSIKELSVSSNSAAGPDGIPASLLLNSASELAPSLPLFCIFIEEMADKQLCYNIFNNYFYNRCIIKLLGIVLRNIKELCWRLVVLLGWSPLL